MEVNIFTCCDGIYKDFIPLFIMSNLYHNDKAFVEIGVDVDNYDKIKDSIDLLKLKFQKKFLVRKIDQDFNIYQKKFKLIPNTVRFFITPKIKTKYVYISDVDIINLQTDFQKIHVENMIKTGLPYSNIVRPSGNRLKIGRAHV